MELSRSGALGRIEAWKLVKANAGSSGVDKETIDDVELDLKNNLYRIWNRMSSGSYFPPAVKAVAIPKKNGGERILGIPTVADRVAQMVVKMVLEPALEPIFLPDSALASAGDARRFAHRQECDAQSFQIGIAGSQHDALFAVNTAFSGRLRKEGLREVICAPPLACSTSRAVTATFLFKLLHR